MRNTNALNIMMDNFFNKSISDILNTEFTFKQPAVNIVKSEGKSIIEIAAPGMKKEDFDIKVNQGQLIVSASVSASEEENERTFKRREFNYSTFKRAFALDKDINTSDIEATYENGLLSITLPRISEDGKDDFIIEVN